MPGSLEKILDSLRWLGLDYDEGPEIGGDFGPYVQSERKGIYEDHASELVEKKFAYEDEGALWFKVPKGQKLTWIDLIHKEIEFSSDVIEDFVILKSDGFPTYHLASVVDDHLMQISHVLRGDEWISSTPKHLLLYDSFGWDHPEFGHLPLILGSDKSKLSKRHGAVSALEYRDQGYLPEAIFNFLLLLGWAPKNDQEIFSRDEAIEVFDIDRVNTTSPIFNLEKLDWFNSQWIRRIDTNELADLVKKYNPSYSKEQIIEKLPLVRDRMRTLKDFERLAGFIIDEKQNIGYVSDPEIIKPILERYRSINANNWTSSYISTATISTIDQNQLDKRSVLSNIGTAISGLTVTPPLYDTLEQVGKEKTILRIENAINEKENAK